MFSGRGGCARSHAAAGSAERRCVQHRLCYCTGTAQRLPQRSSSQPGLHDTRYIRTPLGNDEKGRILNPPPRWQRAAQRNRITQLKEQKAARGVAASRSSEFPSAAPRDSPDKQQERKQAGQEAEEIKITELSRGLPCTRWKDNTRLRQTEAKQLCLPCSERKEKAGR